MWYCSSKTSFADACSEEIKIGFEVVKLTLSKHLVAHAQVPSTGASVVFADDVIISGDSHLVFDHFRDAHITVRFSCTLEAVLVGLAN